MKVAGWFFNNLVMAFKLQVGSWSIMDGAAASQTTTEKIPQLKILVVDDDVLNQSMMRVLLTREGHEVDLASNGLEALHLVKLQKYDIVFMDLQMPVMDGIEASRAIRQWENGGQHTFIVALTASFFPEEGNVLFEAGIDNYISKPFELEHIQRLLKYGFQADLSDNPSTDAPLHEMASEQVLDIQKGIVQVGGDADTYSELLGDFIQGLPERARTIQHMFAARDLAALSRAAHNLHGVAASLGALQLSEYARRLDLQSGEGQVESADRWVKEIQLGILKLLEVSNKILDEQVRA
jgi:CheY-like chemotaxis protein